MKNDNDILDAFREEWLRHEEGFSRSLSPELTFDADHAARRVQQQSTSRQFRYYLRAACVALLLAAATDFFSPAPNAAVRANHDMTRSQAINNAVIYLTPDEEA